MGFCTVVNCMDGRVQIPVSNYLRDRFGVENVDTVTEAGPNRIVGTQSSYVLLESILDRVKISVRHHGSVGIAIVGHHDCAGNPASEAVQLEHIASAVKYLGERFKELPVIGLWVDGTWQVVEVCTSQKSAARAV